MTARQDPTPEQIAAECLLIQLTWTPAERLRRLRVDLRPMVACADGRHVEVSADDYERHLAGAIDADSHEGEARQKLRVC